MKNGTITLLLSMLFLAGIAQDLPFEIRGRYSRPVKKEKLNEVRLISDVIPGYPVNWISRYISVEIMGTCSGMTIKAAGTNDVLTAEQKKLLTTADLGTDIIIDVEYEYSYPLTPSTEYRTIHTALTIVPEIEAEFVGGDEQMKKYLRENCINKIPKAIPEELQKGTVRFSINEEGQIINAKVYRPSGDSQMDKLLLEAINKMPRWKPAQNSKGVKVKQEFEFRVGNSGGC